MPKTQFLLKSLTSLTGNLLLSVSDDKLYLRDISITSSGDYNNLVNINPKSSYSDDIYRFYKSVNPDAFYKTSEIGYEIGYCKSRLLPRQFRCLAPLMIGEKLPKYFCIFKYDVQDSDDNPEIQDSEHLAELLSQSKLIKTFYLDDKTTPIGSYLDNLISQPLFFDDSVFFDFKNKMVTYTAISRLQGNIIKHNENCAHLFDSDIHRQDMDSWVQDGYKRNGLVHKNILNIEYLFDYQADSDSNALCGFFGLYINDTDSLMDLSVEKYPQAIVGAETPMDVRNDIPIRSIDPSTHVTVSNINPEIVMMDKPCIKVKQDMMGKLHDMSVGMLFTNYDSANAEVHTNRKNMNIIYRYDNTKISTKSINVVLDDEIIEILPIRYENFVGNARGKILFKERGYFDYFIDMDATPNKFMNALAGSIQHQLHGKKNFSFDFTVIDDKIYIYTHFKHEFRIDSLCLQPEITCYNYPSQNNKLSVDNYPSPQTYFLTIFNTYIKYDYINHDFNKLIKNKQSKRKTDQIPDRYLIYFDLEIPRIVDGKIPYYYEDECEIVYCDIVPVVSADWQPLDIKNNKIAKELAYFFNTPQELLVKGDWYNIYTMDRNIITQVVMSEHSGIDSISTIYDPENEIENNNILYDDVKEFFTDQYFHVNIKYENDMELKQIFVDVDKQIQYVNLEYTYYDVIDQQQSYEHYMVEQEPVPYEVKLSTKIEDEIPTIHQYQNLLKIMQISSKHRYDSSMIHKFVSDWEDCDKNGISLNMDVDNYLPSLYDTSNDMQKHNCEYGILANTPMLQSDYLQECWIYAPDFSERNFMDDSGYFDEYKIIKHENKHRNIATKVSKYYTGNYIVNYMGCAYKIQSEIDISGYEFICLFRCVLDDNTHTDLRKRKLLINHQSKAIVLVCEFYLNNDKIFIDDQNRFSYAMMYLLVSSLCVSVNTVNDMPNIQRDYGAYTDGHAYMTKFIANIQDISTNDDGKYCIRFKDDIQIESMLYNMPIYVVSDTISGNIQIQSSGGEENTKKSICLGDKEFRFDPITNSLIIPSDSTIQDVPIQDCIDLASMFYNDVIEEYQPGLLYYKVLKEVMNYNSQYEDLLIGNYQILQTVPVSTTIGSELYTELPEIVINCIKPTKLQIGNGLQERYDIGYDIATYNIFDLNNTIHELKSLMINDTSDYSMFNHKIVVIPKDILLSVAAERKGNTLIVDIKQVFYDTYPQITKYVDFKVKQAEIELGKSPTKYQIEDIKYEVLIQLLDNYHINFLKVYSIQNTDSKYEYIVDNQNMQYYKDYYPQYKPSKITFKDWVYELEFDDIERNIYIIFSCEIV